MAGDLQLLTASLRRNKSADPNAEKAAPKGMPEDFSLAEQHNMLNGKGRRHIDNLLPCVTIAPLHEYHFIIYVQGLA